MKVVNDKLDYIDESDKKKGYNLKDGKKIYKTGLVNEVTAKAGRVWSKKSNEEVSRNKGEFLFSVSFKSVTVE
jgi:hypothetical protein